MQKWVRLLSLRSMAAPLSNCLLYRPGLYNCCDPGHRGHIGGGPVGILDMQGTRRGIPVGILDM